jgi:hypothetical protein
MATSGLTAEKAIDWKPFVTNWSVSGLNGPSNIHYLKVDLGAGNTATPDTLCFIDHNFHTITSGIGTFVLRYSDNDTTYYPVFSPAKTVTSDKLQYKDWTGVIAARYWKLEFVGVCYDYLRVGQVAIGRRLVFPEGLQQGFDPLRERALQSNPVSEVGVFLGVDVRRVDKAYSLDWNGTPGVTADFFDADLFLSMPTWWAHAGRQAKPFFFAWDSDSADPEYCRVTPETFFRAPFGDTYLRRGLNLDFDVIVEI